MILRYVILFALGFGMAMMLLWARKRASESQKWLLLTASGVTITELLYFLEISYGNLESMLLTYNLLYAFKAFSLLCFAMFLFTYCEIKVNRMVFGGALGFSVLLVLVLISNQWHGLIYQVVGIGEEFIVPYLILEPKILYYVFVYGMCCFMVYCGAMLLKNVPKSNGVQRKRYIILAVIMMLPTTGLFMQAVLGWTRVDYVVVDLTIGMWLLFVLTKKYGLLDTLQVAKESIMDSSAEGLLVVDTEYHVLYANRAVEEKFPDVLEMCKCGDEEERKRIFAQPETVYRENGAYFEIRVSKLYEGELLLGYMAWFLDMSFVNEYTNQILHLKDAAERANRERMDFLRKLAEDVKLPMDEVLDSAELILQQTGNTEETKEYAFGLREAGRKMEHIMNEAIGHFKSENKKGEQKTEPYYTQVLLEEISQVILEQAVEKGLQYKIIVDRELPYRMNGSASNVKKVLKNVMSHVVRCSEQGSISLEIRCKWRTKKQIQLEVLAGYGHHNMEKSELGTDLGISLIRRLLEQLDGEIKFEETEHEVAKLVFYLEQEIVDERPIGDISLMLTNPVESEFTQAFISTAKVLLVDDCKEDIDCMQKVLSNYGIIIDIVECGAAALDMLKEQTYDMIFVDHMIKDMGGMETMLRIRELDKGKYQQLPVIALAENNAAAVMEEVVMLGFDGYLVKPVDEQKLAKMMLTKLPKTKISYIATSYVKGE